MAVPHPRQSQSYSHSPSSQVTPSDLALLDMLTGPSNPTMRSRHAHPHSTQQSQSHSPSPSGLNDRRQSTGTTPHLHNTSTMPGTATLAGKKLLPRREQPLDPLLISAVIEGSAPLATRNHFGHEFQAFPRRLTGTYSTCDSSPDDYPLPLLPSSPSSHPSHSQRRLSAPSSSPNRRSSSGSGTRPNRLGMRSMQAPRRERLRALGLLAEQGDGEGGNGGGVGLQPCGAGEGNGEGNADGSESPRAGMDTIHEDDTPIPNSNPSSDPTPTSLPLKRTTSRLSQSQSNLSSSPVSSKFDPDPATGQQPMSMSRTKRRLSVDPSVVRGELVTSPRMGGYAPLPSTAAAGGGAAEQAVSQAGTRTEMGQPKLEVRCQARTRVPTPHGEIFLHLYLNNHDQKEHLAIVVDPLQLDPHLAHPPSDGTDQDDGDNSGTAGKLMRSRKPIRSKTLDAIWREGETEMERLVRGAYVGRLTSLGGKISLPDEGGKMFGVDADRGGVPPEGAGGVGVGIGVEDGWEGEDVDPLVRIHSECYTGETIGSMRCDCGEQLDEALRQICEEQVVHLRRKAGIPAAVGGAEGKGDAGLVKGLSEALAGVDMTEGQEQQQREVGNEPMSGVEEHFPLSVRGGAGGEVEEEMAASMEMDLDAASNAAGGMTTGLGTTAVSVSSRSASPSLSNAEDAAHGHDHGHSHGHGRKDRRQAFLPGRGVIVYLRQEGRGIGLLEKIRAYNLQDLGHDTVSANLLLGHGADERKYDIAAEILRDLGMGGEGQVPVRLLTNNPEKMQGLAQEGIRVSERVGLVPRGWQVNTRKNRNHSGKGSHVRDAIMGDVRADALDEEDEEEKAYDDWKKRRGGATLIGGDAARGPELEKYLRTKVERMGHMLEIPKS